MKTSRNPASVIHAAVVREVARLPLPVRAAVLDAPCGDGTLSARIAATAGIVVGADIDDPRRWPNAKEHRFDAAGTLSNLRFVVADLDKPLPWRASSFDLVLCVEGIEHLEDAFAFCREAHRICRPGGYLLLTTPNILSIRSRIRYLGSGFYTQDPRPLDESLRDPLHHVGLRTFWEWRYMLHTCGFTLVRVTHTHIKPVSRVYALCAPFIRAYTRIAMRKEKNPSQRDRNREIARAMVSPSLLLGENILLAGRRRE